MRVAAITGVAAAFVLGSATPAAAAIIPTSKDWGTVIPGVPLQADSWVARVVGLTGSVDTALFGSHSPGIPPQPNEKNGGQGLIDLTAGGIGIGKGDALYSRAMTNKTAQLGLDGPESPYPGAAYASAGGAQVVVGLPYVAPLPICIPNPLSDCVEMSPLGVKIGAIQVQATGLPGKPVVLQGSAAQGYISVLGKKVIDIPLNFPPNFGLRIPDDPTKNAIAEVMLNEQVTVDDHGNPTVAPGTTNYQFDSKATSGYVNGAHASVLGLQGIDATVGHAAVLQPLSLNDIPMVAPELLAASGLVALAGYGGLLAFRRRADAKAGFLA